MPTHSLYSVSAFASDLLQPVETVSCGSARDIEREVQAVFQRHPECSVIQVMANHQVLYTMGHEALLRLRGHAPN